MNRPQRDPTAPLFGARDIVFSLLQSGAVLLTVLSVFGISLYQGYGETEARALTLATLIIGVISLSSSSVLGRAISRTCCARRTGLFGGSSAEL